MALSDLLIRLGNQAKSLEETASALHEEQDADLTQREAELRSALTEVKASLDRTVEVGSDVASTRLTDLQRTISAGFESLRIEGSDRGRADAGQAIAFAVHALQEAEYYVLAATVSAGDGAEQLPPAAAKQTPKQAVKSKDVPKSKTVVKPKGAPAAAEPSTHPSE